MKGRERQVFIKMLPDYLRHMSEYQNSTLCRFFGMYTVKMKGLSAESMEGRPPAGYTVVVMGNALNTSLSIGVKYDLKGSTSKRIVHPEEMMEKAKASIAKKLEEKGMLPLRARAQGRRQALTRLLESGRCVVHHRIYVVCAGGQHLRALRLRQDGVADVDVHPRGRIRPRDGVVGALSAGFYTVHCATDGGVALRVAELAHLRTWHRAD